MTKHLPANTSQTGMTLLELVVALAIFSLILTIASINGVKLLERSRENMAFTQLETELSQLRHEALAQGHPIILPADIALLTVPEGWRFSVNSPVIYRENGICLGGVVTVVAESGRQKIWSLVPPTCAVAG